MVADGDFLAGVLAAMDVEVISSPKLWLSAGQYVWGDSPLPADLLVREQRLSVKVVVAINSMNKQGHYARLCRYEDRMWVEIDQCMLASFDEIEELVDGVYSFEELADRFKRRYTEELGGL